MRDHRENSRSTALLFSTFFVAHQFTTPEIAFTNIYSFPNSAIALNVTEYVSVALGVLRIIDRERVVCREVNCQALYTYNQVRLGRAYTLLIVF